MKRPSLGTFAQVNQGVISRRQSQHYTGDRAASLFAEDGRVPEGEGRQWARFRNDSFKSHDTWLTRSHVPMQIIYSRWDSFLYFQWAIHEDPVLTIIGLSRRFTLVSAESTYHWSCITRIMLIHNLYMELTTDARFLIIHYNIVTIYYHPCNATRF